MNRAMQAAVILCDLGKGRMPPDDVIRAVVKALNGGKK